MFFGHHTADKACRQGLLSGQEPAGEDHIHGCGLAHGSGEALRSTGSGHHADVDLGLADLRGFRGDDHIAEHHQFTAATEGVPADRGDDRLLDALDSIPDGELITLVHLKRRALGHVTDVRSGRPRPFAAGEYDDVNGIVAVKRFHLLSELRHELGIQRVEDFGAVEADDADVPVGFAEDESVFGHGLLAFSSWLLARGS